ncbi:MAG: HNH endonuclease, partial [bacterium]
VAAGPVTPCEVAAGSATPCEVAAGPAYSGRHTSAPRSSPLMRPTPGPARHRIVFWVPLDVAGLWNAAIRACRRVSGRRLSDWECLEALIASARETWEDAGDPGWRRRYSIFERDGWRCQAPGCTSRQNLNEHHIVLRSQGGGDEEANLVTLCVGHHQQGVHEGRVRCRGLAPGGLWWELGVRPDGPPLARYFGDLLLGSPVALNAVGSARNPAP